VYLTPRWRERHARAHNNTQGGSVEYINFVLFEQTIVDNAIKGAINPMSW
jgi:hypothetical protein